MKSRMYPRAGRMTRGTSLAALCRGTAPEWVALQDGDGTWTRAQPIADGATQLAAELGGSIPAASLSPGGP